MSWCYSENGNPGPGKYQPINDLSAEGFYVLSKNLSAGKRAILLGNRDSYLEPSSTMRENPNPGPGYYRLPSDFGHYDEPA